MYLNDVYLELYMLYHSDVSILISPNCIPILLDAKRTLFNVQSKINLNNDHFHTTYITTYIDLYNNTEIVSLIDIYQYW